MAEIEVKKEPTVKLVLNQKEAAQLIAILENVQINGSEWEDIYEMISDEFYSIASLEFDLDDFVKVTAPDKGNLKIENPTK